MFTVTIKFRAALAAAIPAFCALLGPGAPAASAQNAQPAIPGGVSLKQDIPYKEIRSRPLALDLYLPEETARSPLPLVIYIHGGGYRKGEKTELLEIPFYRDLLLGLVRDNKAAVASIDFSKGSKKAPLSLLLQDCKDAVAWLRDHAAQYNIDPARMGLLGNNSGGYLALMTGLAGPAVSFIFAHAPPTDFERAYERLSQDEDPEAQKLLNQMEIGLEGSPEKAAENYASLSPVNNIAQGAPPLLLFVGREQPAYEHAVWLKQAADKNGASLQLTVIEHAARPFYEEGPEVSPTLTELQDNLQDFILAHF